MVTAGKRQRSMRLNNIIQDVKIIILGFRFQQCP